MNTKRTGEFWRRPYWRRFLVAWATLSVFFLGAAVLVLTGARLVRWLNAISPTLAGVTVLVVGSATAAAVLSSEE